MFFSATLQVKRVEVVGNELLSDGRVREIADVPLGEQLALVDLGRADARVGSLAEVKSVDVTRTWPDGVRIRSSSAPPSPWSSWPAGCAASTPTAWCSASTRPCPRGCPASGPAAGAGTDALKEAATVVSALPEDLATRVDHVEVETVDQITLVMRDERQVLWGSAEESELKAEVVDRLLAAQKAHVYDVSVPGNPTVR